MPEPIEEFLKEAEVDYIALWEVAQAAREDLGAATDDQTRKLSLDVVKRLYERGLRP